MPWTNASLKEAEIFTGMRYHWDLFIKKISKLHHLLVVRYRTTKMAKISILPSSRGICRKSRTQPFQLKIFLVVALPTMNTHTKFQLNPLSCSRDIVATMRRYFSIMNFRAFRKNSIKNQRFNIFWCDLRQTSSNTRLYHICENERNRRYRLSTLGRGLYAMALIETRMNKLYFCIYFTKVNSKYFLYYLLVK